MKKIIIIPDSFKGTLGSKQLCSIMSKAIKAHYPHCTIIEVPVADGGEGTVDSFLDACHGKRIKCTVSGPYFEKINTSYALVDTTTAIIEMASCAGLPLVGDKKNPLKTSTYGVGEQMIHAIENGATRIIMGLGGSATNDGGCGAAAACGIQFTDAQGKAFIPVGGTLKHICQIDTSTIDPRIKNSEIISMCDIDNPLLGSSGAAAIFGPQKGADPTMVKRLDEGLAHLAQQVKKDLEINNATAHGSGAAGGMGFGMQAFFSSKLQMGIETVLDVVQFTELCRDCNLILTGEGKIDTQSLRGKVVMGVAKRAKAAKVPVIAIVGDIGNDIESIYHEGLCAILSINRVALPYEQQKIRAAEDVYHTVDTLMRILKTSNKIVYKN